MRTALPIPAFARGRSKPAPPDLAPTLSEAIDRLGQHRQLPLRHRQDRRQARLAAGRPPERQDRPRDDHPARAGLARPQGL